MVSMLGKQGDFAARGVFRKEQGTQREELTGGVQQKIIPSEPSRNKAGKIKGNRKLIESAETGVQVHNRFQLIIVPHHSVQTDNICRPRHAI
jgi:hypothetical protein